MPTSPPVRALDGEPQARDMDLQTLDTAMERAYAFGKELHGDLNLAEPVYRERVTLIVERWCGKPVSDSGAVSFARTLHTNDLYLSLACAERSESAWRRFRSLYYRYLSDVFRYANFARCCPGELADSLVTDMFLPDRHGRSKIGSYQGRCSLRTWLKVVASNDQFNRRQQFTGRTCTLEALSEPPDIGAAAKVESGLRQSRYGKVFAEAFEKACRNLTEGERELLLWKYDENLKLSDIASRIGIHQSNVTRHLDKLCVRLRASVIDLLETDNGLSSAAIAECLLTVFDEYDDPAGIIAVLKQSADNPRESAKQRATFRAAAV